MTFKDFVRSFNGTATIPVITNQDIAIDLLTKIQSRPPKDQQEIAVTILRHVCPGVHAHRNPQKKVAT